MKWTFAPCAADMSVVNESRPEAMPSVRISWSPGSKKGASPFEREATFRSSTSIPTTSCPIEAIAAA